MKLRRLLVLFAIAAPAAVLLGAAVPKLARPDLFALALFRYQLFPHAAINALAVFVPWLELTAGLALAAVPRLRRGAAGISALLLTAFAGVLAFNLVRGVLAPCGCFSLDPDAAPAGWAHVAGNLALAALCAWTARGRKEKGKASKEKEDNAQHQTSNGCPQP